MSETPIPDSPEVCPLCGGEVTRVKCRQVCLCCRALIANCNGD